MNAFSLGSGKKVIYTLSNLIRHITENSRQHNKVKKGKKRSGAGRKKGGVEAREKKRVKEQNSPGQREEVKTAASLSR